MSTILVTGATGFIGSRLAARLGNRHNVVTISRTGGAEADGTHVIGNFTSAEALRQLDGVPIDAVIHLAAEVGGCTEEAGLATNVGGTRTLLRYCIERGCRRYVLASSIAAVGSLTRDFLPREVPIPDDHPCDAIDPYGLSKALMEEVAYYFQRREPDLSIDLFRIGAVLPDDAPAVEVEMLDTMPFPFIDLAAISVGDVVTALERSIEQSPKPGIRRMNLVADCARTPLSVPETLERLFGSRAASLDLSYYAKPGNDAAALYTTDRMTRELGFSPAVDVRTMTAASG